MIARKVRAVSDALLYEGYALYPYRASATKNRWRWTFGTLGPPGTVAPSTMQCECLLAAGADATLEFRIRFLQLRACDAALGPASPVPGSAAWPDAAEREVMVGPIAMATLLRGEHRHAFASGPDGGEGVSGIVACSALELADDGALRGEVERRLYRVHLHVENVTAATPLDRAASLSHALVSCHAVLGVYGGRFVSMSDPPEALRGFADACTSRGAWPILVGDPARADVVLCSPIIFDDYPAVAPESAGDFFDLTEIDELLTLGVLALTDEEKRQMATDRRTQAILARTEALATNELADLHGRLASRPAHARNLRPGDRVRLRPRRRGDVLDLALAGKAATVVSIEMDYDDRRYVTVAVDDDPGRDLGVEGMPGHRFFFHPDEVERLLEGEEQG